MTRLAVPALILTLLISSATHHATAQQASSAADTCAALVKLTLPNTRIASAQLIDAGALPPPPHTPPEQVAALKHLPAFCRVVAHIAPSTDSDIQVEVWMPATNWNGKFRGQGNGGFAGVIDYSGLALAVSQGYASAATDTGHAAFFTDATWALGHPEKVADFGYRAIHEMTQQGKAIVAAYYSAAPKHSYFAACSDGGREALMEAQRFPEDYDGILAGAPAYNWTRLVTTAANNMVALTLDPASYIPATKLPAISAAVIAACDAKDDVTDGVLNDPRQCHFDPATIACKAADSDSCLTAAQVTALKALYAGSHDAAGHQVFPGYLPGSELGPGGWEPWILGAARGKGLIFAFGSSYFADMVYENPNWDYKTFTVDSAVKAANQKTAHAINATDPNLKPFLSRGGKLILYHGWNDPAISALSTIDYYDNLTSATGEQIVNSSVRLFMVPGMQHCGDGPGPDSFGQVGSQPAIGSGNPQNDIYLALEQWVEKGHAPEKIIASKNDLTTHAPTMTRPLCPYPQAAKYKGSGDTNNVANFTCAPE